tara:strand:- start:706 stop:978 length:273 start_codon:yes stop_codon:yes gene_type:complete
MKMLEETLFNQIKESQFAKDFDKPLNINGQESNRATWNLICSIRDVSLFTKGMTITRNWRLKDVKNYFNIKGDKHKILYQLKNVKRFLQE